MGPQIIHLPDGQNFTVTPVFAGLFFKSHELNTHQNAFPIGWSVVLHTEDTEKRDNDHSVSDGSNHADGATAPTADRDSEDKDKQPQTHAITRAFTRPTLQSDSLFISSISQPSNTEFKPAASPSRQIAMMLWITLYWYFHQPPPSPVQNPATARLTPLAGKPHGEWRINIRRDGVLRGRNLIPKLERMGLIASMDSAVGTSTDEASGDEWERMFVSRRMFWQIPGRLFLFTLQPNPPGSPVTSRPGSPSPSTASGAAPQPLIGELSIRASSPTMSQSSDAMALMSPSASTPPMNLTTLPSFPIGPFYSASHLPTYYPPAPTMYVMTDHIRHPLRPKPPRMGEVFYTRFVPSVGQYLSFRVASLSPKPVPYLGPVGPSPPNHPQVAHLGTLSDTQLLQQWLGNPRVSAFWGQYVDNFLPNALSSRNSFPVIGLWDGVPFGYFEVYWVKEDILGKYMGGAAAHDWDRGIHVLVGEEWGRGRVQIWLSSLVHWAFTTDYRTMSVCIEPRVDNQRFIQHLQFAGFQKEREVSFPHKQSWVGRLRREFWEGPAL